MLFLNVSQEFVCQIETLGQQIEPPCLALTEPFVPGKYIAFAHHANQGAMLVHDGQSANSA